MKIREHGEDNTRTEKSVTVDRKESIFKRFTEAMNVMRQKQISAQQQRRLEEEERERNSDMIRAEVPNKNHDSMCYINEQVGQKQYLDDMDGMDTYENISLDLQNDEFDDSLADEETTITYSNIEIQNGTECDDVKVVLSSGNNKDNYALTKLARVLKPSSQKSTTLKKHVMTDTNVSNEPITKKKPKPSPKPNGIATTLKRKNNQSTGGVQHHLTETTEAEELETYAMSSKRTASEFEMTDNVLYIQS